MGGLFTGIIAGVCAGVLIMLGIRALILFPGWISLRKQLREHNDKIRPLLPLYKSLIKQNIIIDNTNFLFNTEDTRIMVLTGKSIDTYSYGGLKSGLSKTGSIDLDEKTADILNRYVSWNRYSGGRLRKLKVWIINFIKPI